MELENTLQNIALVILVIAIIYLLYKSNQENFADTPTLTLDSIKDEINKQYNLDIEAIRNLGAISKSLMTGTNYISTKTDGKPGDLTIPADNTSFSGNVNMDGNLNVKGGIISTPNKLQINGNDSLVLLNKNGVVISKASNGNGNLTVEGNLSNSGNLSNQGNLTINGTTTLKNIIIDRDANIFNRKMDNMYFQEDSIIYQDISDIYKTAKTTVFQKYNNPSGWNDTAYTNNNYGYLNMINIGNGTQQGSAGAKIQVPVNKTVLWLRVLTNRHSSISLYDSNGSYIFTYTSSFRNLTKYSPDGGYHDIGSWEVWGWMPIPVKSNTLYIINSGNPKSNTGNDGWIGGIAFSSNPWNHAMACPLTYHWNANGKNNNIIWHSDNWHNDILARIDENAIGTMIVPIVFSGKDKLLYIVEHNSNWSGGGIKSITVNGTIIESLRTTYNNPFATNFNSKIYNRFLAGRIPSKLITSDAISITVVVDRTQCGGSFCFREVGTIDYN